MTVPGEYHYDPDYGASPYSVLLDILDDLGMSQADLARRTGLSVKHINQVCQGLAPITADTAVLLHRATGLDTQIWLRLESASQAERGIRDETIRLKNEVEWLKGFPLRELKRRGWIRPEAKGTEEVRELLQFFRVAGSASWDRVWATPTAYRLSQAFAPDMASLASWIRIGELRAGSIALNEYDREAFRDRLPEIRSLTRETESKEWIPRLQSICAAAGVAVVVEREIKGARVNGIVRWLPSGNPLIMLSGRHRWTDIFWFTFFHEAGHLIIHDRRRLTFVDSPSSRADGGDATANRVIEEEADEFASRSLLPAIYGESITMAKSADDARRIAEEAGVHAGIVVGRMQHDGIISYSQLNDLRSRLALADD